MSALYTWLLSGWLHLIVGIAIGWVVFKRPDLMDRFFEKMKDLFGVA